MYVCTLCGSESQSVSAMLACEQDCTETDAATRDYFTRHNPNHRD